MTQAVSLLKTLPPTAYNVTLIAPDNYFCFTPLLPSACVGTVEPRSLVEPLRRLVARVHGHFLNGQAVDIDMADRLLEVEVPTEEGTGTMRAYVPYDKLVIAVGSRSNDHGVKGLEYCHQLKTIPDAQAIRRRIMSMSTQSASRWHLTDAQPTSRWPRFPLPLPRSASTCSRLLSAVVAPRVSSLRPSSRTC